MSRKLFQVIDFDRTIFDTALFIEALTTYVDREHPGLGKGLKEAVEAAYKQEKTFFLLRYLREALGLKKFEALVDQVILENGSEAFFLPGARERLAMAESLTDARPAFGIVTFGDEVDQLMKIHAVKLDMVPVLVTKTPQKAEVVASWLTPTGYFRLPEVFGGTLVEEITIEDDKLRAFHDLPENVTGIWVMEDPGEKINDMPVGIHHVKNLRESIQLLKELYP